MAFTFKNNKIYYEYENELYVYQNDITTNYEFIKLASVNNYTVNPKNDNIYGKRLRIIFKMNNRILGATFNFMSLIMTETINSRNKYTKITLTGVNYTFMAKCKVNYNNSGYYFISTITFKIIYNKDNNCYIIDDAVIVPELVTFINPFLLDVQFTNIGESLIITYPLFD